MQLMWSVGGTPLLIAFLSLYLYALTKGDRTDIASGHVLAFGALMRFALYFYLGKPGQGWPYSASQISTEFLLLAAQVSIAQHTSRHYPIVMAAAQLLVVIACGVSMAGLVSQPTTLVVVFAGTSLMQLCTFACGLAVRRRLLPGATTVTISDR